MIYFVQDKATQRIKIGFTRHDVGGRLEHFQTGCPGQLTVLLQIHGIGADETELKNRFKAFREHGEWFRPVLGVLQAIEEMKATKEQTVRRVLDELQEMDNDMFSEPAEPVGDRTVSEPGNMGAEWLCQDRLAISVYDLAVVESAERYSHLKGRLNLAPTYVQVEEQSVAEAAVEFSCSLLEAAMVCDKIRRKRQTGDLVPRVYVYVDRRNRWSRLSSAHELTVLDGGRCRLNRDVFAGDFVAVETPDRE
jgi:hypothetical protein